MQKLKRCPFCGKYPQMVVDDETEEKFGVKCFHCGGCIYPEKDTVDDAIDAWNRRIQEVLGGMSDLISRQAAIDAIDVYGSVWMEYTDSMSVDEIAERALKASKQSMVKILHDLPSAQPEQRWIPVSERLPEEDEDVLVCYDFKGTKSVYVATCYSDGSFHGYDDEYLTLEGRKHRKAIAWMPLPEPYREEGEE